MGMKLFIKEGGDSRLPNQPKGFYLQLRAEGTNPVNLYTVFTTKSNKDYIISEREADKCQNPLSSTQFKEEALKEAFNLIKQKAIEYQASYQIPVMYQDTNPGEGKVIRNLESFMPEFT